MSLLDSTQRTLEQCPEHVRWFCLACPKAPDASSSVQWPSSGGREICDALCVLVRWSPDASGDPLRVSGDPVEGAYNPRSPAFVQPSFFFLPTNRQLHPSPKSPDASVAVDLRPLRRFPFLPAQVPSKEFLLFLLSAKASSRAVSRVWGTLRS